MSDLTTIARPYAKAAFSYASEHSMVEQWSTMLELAKTMSLVPELSSAAFSLQSQQLLQVYADVAGEQFDQPMLNFLLVLMENRRIAALGDICQQFQKFATESSGTKEVQVVSSYELSDEQVETLTSNLEKRYDCKVKLNCQIDSNLIGGAVIRVEDDILDNSLLGRINRLKDVMKS